MAGLSAEEAGLDSEVHGFHLAPAEAPAGAIHLAVLSTDLLE